MPHVADIDDGHSFHGTPRFYRNAMVALYRAIRTWNTNPGKLDCAIHFGDIIDGFQPKDGSEDALAQI
eukprot:gene30301-35289_t